MTGREYFSATMSFWRLTLLIFHLPLFVLAFPNLAPPIIHRSPFSCTLAPGRYRNFSRQAHILESDEASKISPDDEAKIEATVGSNQTQDHERIKNQTSSDDQQNTNKTLYEILGATPADSKEELKKRYTTLAKLCHPDATRGAAVSSDLDFSAISSAYRVLSDPKQKLRYDRKLKAEAFSLGLQRFAGDLTDKAAPQVRDMFDAVAVPFLRRTTATTLASLKALEKARAMGKGQEGSDPPDISAALFAAWEAAQRAGRIIDTDELMEKSDALENRALEELEEANKMKSKLGDISLKRLHTALRTPDSSFSSEDAVTLLTYWNVSDSPSLLERAKLKKPIDKKIQELEIIERRLADKQTELKEALSNFTQNEKEVQRARADKVLALQEEKRAKELLLKAQRRIADSNSRIQASSKSLSQAESTVDKLLVEEVRLVTGVSRQQEGVKSSLLKKADSFGSSERLQVNLGTEKSADDVDDLRLVEEKEEKLVEEYQERNMMATRLQSRAKKLKERAEFLKDLQ